MIDFNPASSAHLSYLFFGGMISVEETQDAGLYKNGKPKTKKVKILKSINGLGLKPLKEWKTKRDGIYSVDETTLEFIKNLKINGLNNWEYPQKVKDAIKIAELMLEIRGLEKELNTYYDGISNLIYKDNTIHTQFQHVSTGTGRLSSKNPNIQNVTKSTVLEHFISRFEEGVLISADYKSIEPRCEAQMSGDLAAINDVQNEIDPHTKNLALKLRQPYDIIYNKVQSGELKDARSQIKAFTFAVQYGAGDNTISRNSGLSLEEVKELKKLRQKEYPILHLYYNFLQKEVDKNGFYKDPWGRIYKFTKYPNKYKPGIMEYSYNQVVNYRTQGFATATIVLSMLGIFWRKKALFSRNKYLLINTIHDSVIIDCKKEFIEEAKKDLIILEDSAKISKQIFNYEMKVATPIDISVNKNWYLL